MVITDSDVKNFVGDAYDSLKIASGKNTEAKIQKLIESVVNEVDSLLAGSFITPVVEPCEVLKNIYISLVAYRLVGSVRNELENEGWLYITDENKKYRMLVTDIVKRKVNLNCLKFKDTANAVTPGFRVYKPKTYITDKVSPLIEY